jgi:hypothetical protein
MLQAVELSHGSSIVFGTRTSTPVFVHWFPLGVLVSRVAKQPNEALNQQLRVLGAQNASQLNSAPRRDCELISVP